VNDRAICPRAERETLGEAVDRVRRRENKTLRAAGDDRLTGTRYDWLRASHSPGAIKTLKQSLNETNAILHVTC
jgi:hypothetical protein